MTVVSEDFSPNLTSDGAAGIWGPNDVYNTDPERIRYVKPVHEPTEGGQPCPPATIGLVSKLGFSETVSRLKITSTASGVFFYHRDS